ncbi:MAG: RNA polymerase sigma factor [Thermomicrobiales bacterium]
MARDWRLGSGGRGRAAQWCRYCDVPAVENAAEHGRSVGDAEDGALVRRARGGDRAALAALFERHHARVYRAAYLVTRSPEAADDIVQLVFLELFKALETFDPRRPFVPRLYRIAHNVTVDHLKHDRYRHPTIPLADTTPGPTGEIGRAELRSDMRPALDALSHEHREALMLRYFIGLSEREMADVLHVRPGTVKSRLHRALHALGEALGPGSADDGRRPEDPDDAPWRGST